MRSWFVMAIASCLVSAVYALPKSFSDRLDALEQKIKVRDLARLEALSPMDDESESDVSEAWMWSGFADAVKNVGNTASKTATAVEMLKRHPEMLKMLANMSPEKLEELAKLNPKLKELAELASRKIIPRKEAEIATLESTISDKKKEVANLHRLVEGLEGIEVAPEVSTEQVAELSENE